MKHPGTFYRITGPYNRPDGRKHMVAYKRDNSKTTISYPKYLMECHLGRLLNNNETVDHIDRDKTNDDLTNLQVIDRSMHAKLDAKRALPEKVNCPICQKLFRPNKDQRNKRSQSISGPFCSRSCAGKHNAQVGNGLTPLPSTKIKMRTARYNKEKFMKRQNI